MPLMLSKLHEALVEAGASDAKAREAAEEAASQHDAFVRIDAKIESVKDAVMTNRWITGFMFAAIVVMLGMTYNQGAKLSRIESRLEQAAPPAKGSN